MPRPRFRRHATRMRLITLHMSRPLLFRISQATADLDCSRAEFIRRAVVERLERHTASRQFEFPESDTPP